VREAAARMSCQNNMKQLGIALHSFHDANGRMPPGGGDDTPPFGNAPSGWGSSWKVYILPHIEQDNIYKRWQFDTQHEGWQNVNNLSMVNKVTIKTYRCPSSVLPDFHPANCTNVCDSYQMFTTYVGVAGTYTDPNAYTGSICCTGTGNIIGGSGILCNNCQTKMTQITDGTSNTILVGEQSDHLRDNNNQPYIPGTGALTSQGPHGWVMGSGGGGVGVAYRERQFNVTTVRWMINQRGLDNSMANGTNENSGCNIPFTSVHSGGANMLMGDGSVRFMNANTTLAILVALSSRDRGEVIPEQ